MNAPLQLRYYGREKTTGFLLLFCLFTLFLSLNITGCNSCSESSKEKPVAPELKDSKTVNGSISLDWENIKTGISSEKFIKQISTMAGIDYKDAKKRIECGSSQFVGVIDPVYLKIRNKFSPQADLTFCTFFQANLNKSWFLASVRAVFLKDKLVSINYRFKKEYKDTILQQLESRFKKGDERKLNDETLLAVIVQTSILWKVGNDIWAFTQNHNDVSLKLQDSQELSMLKDLSKQKDDPKIKLDIDDKSLELELFNKKATSK